MDQINVVHTYKITFKILSAAFETNGSLIEWKLALFHKKILVDQRSL